MIEFLNANEGVISAVSLVVGVVIAIIGFLINKNISKITQNQSMKNNSKGIQGGRDSVDNSFNVKY